MPSSEAGNPTMEPTAKTIQMISVTQGLTGIDVITADTIEFKTRYAKSVKITLGDHVDSVVVTLVTATRRNLLSSSVTIQYIVMATNIAVTDMEVALMMTVDVLNKEINGYGYTVTAAAPTVFVNMSPTSIPISAPSTSTSPAAVFPTPSPTVFVASNVDVGSLSVNNNFILSVVLVFIGSAAIVGIIIYFCVLRKQTTAPFPSAEKVNREESMNQYDRSIIGDSPHDEHAVKGDVEMEDVEIVHVDDIFPEYSSLNESDFRLKTEVVSDNGFAFL
jgi:hypothetical protein